MMTLPSSGEFGSTIVQLGELDRSADRSARGVRLRNVYAIDAPLFRDILIREWRRADRFDQSFVLVLVESAPNVTGWDEIIQSLARLTHDTDVIGWFERDRVLGLLWLDRDAPNDFAEREIENKVREELARSAHRTSGLSISVHVPRVAEALCGGSPADPLFEELRESQGHPAIRHAAKRVLDVVGSAALLVILLPILALITILVKLTSSGPIFFARIALVHQGSPSPC